MRGLNYVAILGLAGTLVAGPVSQVNAQSTTPAPPQATSPGTAAPSDLSEQKLDAVANALERVAKVEQDYTQQIAAALSSDRQRILEEANSMMTKAVTDQGLSVEEYSKVIEVASNDPDLRQKILRRLPSSR